MKKRKLPLSMTGDNMHSFECEPTGRTCSYAVCQHTVWAYKESRLKGFEDCRGAIDKRACPAIKMMLEERSAGKSIYFDSYAATLIEREKRTAEQLNKERNQWRKSRMIVSSQSSMSEEEIKRRDQEVKARILVEQEETPPVSTTKRRDKAPVDLNSDTGNMFADMVNSMTSEQQ